jgi:hypothetical protein
MPNFAYALGHRLTKQKTAKTASAGHLVYHGSPTRLETLEPRTDHGDPSVPAAVFATPSLQMAVAYAGRKWGGRDINQSSTGGKAWRLREMRPGAFDEIYGEGSGGYLHEMDGSQFVKRPGSLGSRFEVISQRAVTPTSIKHIENPRQALIDAGVELLPYDPEHKSHQAAIKRMAKRIKSMGPEGFREYLAWIRETNPELADAVAEQTMHKKMGFPRNELLAYRLG